ncbi:iron-siderophore ABC transporter substrate-binding protein [Citricoccus sp.]|uniref:iron-siderophore ABC transporter substrate-binding protein n=1 Tax=Citricoccus sp. TaxID=1978372 RepID=UPI002622D3AF|nr:iron-siderophore ABC transporter substrate-binding protein [Citricoccus sp.]HRO28831.1 iron-siderophore ABC transporter substrate-binding protein [Citricoccus sp.]
MSSSPTSPVSPRAGTTRRRALVLGSLALGATLLAGCSTGPAGGSSEPTSPAATAADAGSADAAFPRTIEHAFGETEIPAQPERVATVSWVNQDISLALGVVPVGVAATEYGGNENKSTDWFDAKLEELGAEAPEQYSESDGIDYEAIAATEPDVILATYSGIDQEQYDKLSEIAPVVAYPKGTAAFGTPWQDSTRIIGEALGKDAEAEQVVADVEGQLAAAAEDHPELAGTTFLYGTVDPAAADQVYLFTATDNRPKFLSALGMDLAPVVAEDEAAQEAFYITWSPERADELDSDIFVSSAADESVGQAIADDPLLGSIPAVQDGTLVLQTDEQEVLSISASSPLSIPWALENALPKITEAAQKAGGSPE